MEEYLEKYRVWLVMKNYAKRTQKCYLSALKNYWIWCEKMQKSNPQFKQKDAVQTRCDTVYPARATLKVANASASGL